MRRIVTGLAALLIAAPSAASAQSANAHQGFWASVGLGYGSAAIDVEGTSSDRESNLALSIAMGGTYRQNLLLGGELSGWQKEQDGATGQIAFLTAFAQYYPMAEMPLYVRGGLGYGRTTLEDDASGDEIESGGFALALGLGYDVRVGQNFSVTPYFNYSTTLGAKADYNGASTGAKMNGNVLQLGVAATWH